MARITVEDCIGTVPNRYELIMLAAHRARELSAGATPTVALDGDKPSVIALREIAAGTLDPKLLRESLVKRMQRAIPDEEGPEETDAGDRFDSDRANQAFAEMFGEEGAAPDAPQMAPDADDETRDPGGWAEPTDEDLADLDMDTMLDENAA
ncbi:MAG: DNA-directed RNA polymerase subunit omega [Alphaproteobacteria bacterium]